MVDGPIGSYSSLFRIESGVFDDVVFAAGGACRNSCGAAYAADFTRREGGRQALRAIAARSIS